MFKLIKKALMYMKQDGAVKTLKKTVYKIYKDFKKIPCFVGEYFVKDKCIKELKKKCDGKKVVVMIPCIDWNIPIYQRPHQLANAFAEHEDTFILFLSDQYQYDNICFCEEITQDIYLYSIRMSKYLNSILKDSAEVIILMSWTRYSYLTEIIKYDKLIYEYIDELSLFYYYDEEIEKTHRLLLENADLTIATADKLYQNAKPYAKKIILSENAADYNFFHRNINCEVNKLIKDKIKDCSCVIGYYGCLASWFDYDLINYVANKKKNWKFILVGYDFDGTFKKLNECNNIIHIPAQPYKDLPSFLSGFDIAMIPFLINDITESTSPVKLFEYMSASKPTLTSKLPECKKYKSIFTYKDYDDFIEKVEFIMSKKQDKEYMDMLNKDALENTWNSRVQQVLNEFCN